MEIDGGGHRGRIRYRARGRPGGGLFLPLRRGDLRRHGALAVPVPEAEFRLLSGTPKVCEKPGESERTSRQHF